MALQSVGPTILLVLILLIIGILVLSGARRARDRRHMILSARRHPPQVDVGPKPTICDALVVPLDIPPRRWADFHPICAQLTPQKAIDTLPPPLPLSRWWEDALASLSSIGFQRMLPPIFTWLALQNVPQAEENHLRLQVNTLIRMPSPHRHMNNTGLPEFMLGTAHVRLLIPARDS